MRSRLSLTLSVLALSLLMPKGAVAAIDPRAAAALFAEADAICARDGGALWGRTLCGPMLLVDPADRSVLANTADGDGVLKREGDHFVGVLPDSVMIANTPTQWAGVRWTMLMWPVFEDPARRHVTLAHELFHRIQPDLNLMRQEGGNWHLDTLEGRWLLQLEWRALARALTAGAPQARRGAVADAVLFRRERYRLFPKAAAEEAALEIDEGVPEYTGVRLGLATAAERQAYALHDLEAYVDAPTFVRSFAYATGAAWGLLLDEADPAWRGKIASGPRFDELLATALKLPQPDFGTVQARAALYDSGAMRTREVARDKARQARLAGLKQHLVDGPVLVLPLGHVSYQFNPQTLQPLDPYGLVYPTARLSDRWGVLEVESGGVLLAGDMKAARVSAVGASGTAGQGWTLKLAPGWTVSPGARKGDLTLQPPSAARP